MTLLLRQFFTLAAMTAIALSAPGSASAQSKDKVKIVMSSWGVLYWPTLVAAELGYFGEEGIDVEIIRTGSGVKSLAAVASGDAHINVGAPSSALRAHSKGSDVMVISPSISQYADNLVMTTAWAGKHNITAKTPYKEKIKALKGMTIGVASVGGGADQLVRLMAKEAGLNADRDLTLTAMSTGENMIAALKQGRIDGFVFPSPTSDEAIKNHGAQMMIHTAAGEVPQLDGFVYIGLVVRKSWVTANPDLTVRLLRAHQRALDTIRDPAKNLVARDAVRVKYHAQSDVALFNGLWESSRSSFPKTVEMNRGMMERVFGFVNEFSADPLPKSVLETAWSNEYSAKALASMKR